MTLISGRMTYSSFYVTAFPIGPLLGVPSIPLEAGWLILGRSFTYIMKSWLAVSFGEVADWERRHSNEGVSGRERRHPG